MDETDAVIISHASVLCAVDALVSLRLASHITVAAVEVIALVQVHCIRVAFLEIVTKNSTARVRAQVDGRFGPEKR